MKKQDKSVIIERLTKEINSANHIYLTDMSELNAEATSELRRMCFSKEVKLCVAKNTLLKKAFDQAEGDFADLEQALVGQTSIMFSEHGNVPAKLIKEFRKKGHKRPLLKAAYVEETSYIGEEQLSTLVNIKSKNELIGDIILLLQSPIKNVISALQASGGDKIAGIVKTLSEKEE